MGDQRRIVVVGASLAGLRAAHTLRDEGFGGELVMVGDEPEAPYDRPPLSKDILAGAMEPSDLTLSVHEELGAVWRLGTAATGLDTVRGALQLATGEELAYDGLILATGSSARTLPVFDTRRDDVHVIRGVADALALRAALRPGVRLLVVGCGFVGVEVAASATKLGAEVTMVGLDQPLAPAGPLAGRFVTGLLVSAGVDLHAGQGLGEVSERDGGYRVTLTDGAVVEADQVVVAVGSVPNTAWLAGSGLSVEDGVACDESLRVRGARDVVAAGDIARWPNPTFGGLEMRVEHWSNAIEQGAAAARTLLRGDDAEPFGSVPSFWSDHFGIRLQSVGLPRLADRFELLAGDPADGKFAAAAYAGDVLVGGIAYGMPRPLIGVRLQLAKSGAILTRTPA